MCAEPINKEKEKYDYLLEMINKSIDEGDKKIRKLFKQITK